MKLKLVFISWALLAIRAMAGPELTLWYQQPAKTAVTEALPIGNGRLGALVFGDPAAERLVLNENSLWTGDENPSGNYDTMGAYQVLGSLFIKLAGQEKTENYRRDLDLSSAIAHVSYESGGVHYQREFFASHPAGVIVGHFSADH